MKQIALPTLETKPLLLTVGDLRGLSSSVKITSRHLSLQYVDEGSRKHTPVRIPIGQVLRAGRKGLVDYILNVSKYSSKLIPFIFENQSLIELALHLYRRRDSNSPHGTETLASYANVIQCYCRDVVKLAPDELLRDARSSEDRVEAHLALLQRYIDDLREQGISSNTISNRVTAIQALYHVNRVPGLRLADRPRRRRYTESRLPTDDEIRSLILHSDLREKVILSLMLLSGLREGTIVKLKISHVLDDLQRGIIPTSAHQTD